MKPIEQMFIEGVLSGMSPTASARAAGYKDAKGAAKRLMQREDIKFQVERANFEATQRMQVTREDVINGLLDAIRNATSAAEQIMGWKEVGKIVGAYEPIKVEVKHSLGDYTKQQLADMPDEELARLAEEAPFAIDADFEDVTDDDDDEDLLPLPAGEEPEHGLLRWGGEDLQGMPEGSGDPGEGEETGAA